MSIARDHPLSAHTHHPSFDLFCHRHGRRRNHRLLLRSKKMKTEPYRNRSFFLKTEPKSIDLAKCETVTTLIVLIIFASYAHICTTQIIVWYATAINNLLLYLHSEKMSPLISTVRLSLSSCIMSVLSLYESSFNVSNSAIASSKACSRQP